MPPSSPTSPPLPLRRASTPTGARGEKSLLHLAPHAEAATPPPLSGGSSGWIGFGPRPRPDADEKAKAKAKAKSKLKPEPEPHHAPYQPSFAADAPTLWGLSPWELHDRLWASRGVQVVRHGVAGPLRFNAELFLLLDPYQMVHFSLKTVLDDLNWLQPLLLTVRLHHGPVGSRYRERVVTGPNGRFADFKRDYRARRVWTVARVGLTPSRGIAEAWQNLSDDADGWRRTRREVPRERRCVRRMDGVIADSRSPRAINGFVQLLPRVWKRPDSTITRAVPYELSVNGIWHDEDAKAGPGPLGSAASRVIGPIWIGAGRQLPQNLNLVGPAVLWDDPAQRPESRPLEWGEIEPLSAHPEPPTQNRSGVSFYRVTKRLFDFFSALIGLTLCGIAGVFVLPAIWLEDGPPFFFGHTRQTLGGRNFTCWKFRTMQHNADSLKDQLKDHNQADGNQFFIENDPRLTRVGKLLRKLDIDELPQFWNVLKGEMSLVGPRPSPDKENQLSPGWRDARLAVRPGITGLWQVERTRQEGKDFQEWIVYDIRYVEDMSWPLDVKIITRTILKMIGIRLPFAGWGRKDIPDTPPPV